MPNKLYFGDNLDVMRDWIEDESVDLVYLDPPFKSDARYNVLFRSPAGEVAKAQATAFRDTWTWDRQAEWAFEEVARIGGSTATIVNALYSGLGQSDLMAYLVMMAVRLHELHRVLKRTGSLYLHCDPTASHYLKIILDGIFGPRFFRNEIIWQRTTPKGLAFTRFASNHDVILYYSRSDNLIWNPQYYPHSEKYRARYSLIDEATGRRFQATSLINPNADRPNLTYEFHGHTRVWRWRRERMEEAERQGLIYLPPGGGVPREKRFLDEQEGVPLNSVWTDVPPINSQARERLGYPTQKPLTLLERIIPTSSNRGDVVLDPFCGCGTTVHAAEKLGRRWIGIDVAYHAIQVIRSRLHRHFGEQCRYELGGVPSDVESARLLAEKDRYQFQWWANYLVGVERFREVKRGRDRGIDGEIFFPAGPGRGLGRILTSVKSGKTRVADLRDFRGVLEREKADAGIFVCMGVPTRDMRADAASAGYFQTGKDAYPRLQIVSVQEWFEGKTHLELPTTRHLARRLNARAEVGNRRRPRMADPRQIEMKLAIPGGKKGKEAVHLNPALLLSPEAEAAEG